VILTRAQYAQLLADCYSYQQAITQGELLLEEQAASRGPDHPDTLSTRNTLAGWRWRAGDLAAAAAAYEDLLADASRVLGPDHPDTLATRSNLVSLRGEAGDPAGAAAACEVLAAGFGELAAQLGVRGLADTRDPVASVHSVLAGSATPWLLILDNAADMASVETFLPPSGPGRVLITSQNPAWPGQPLDVPLLDRDVAAGFLVNRTGDPDSRAALDLADLLVGFRWRWSRPPRTYRPP
jgi:hypothetical protein